jgi:hypothetical protein
MLSYIKSSIIKLYNSEKHVNNTDTLPYNSISFSGKIILPYNSISFSGGGYNCVYHIGVVKYIFENPNLFRTMKYIGASGGAGISGIILCYENQHNKMQVLSNIIHEIIEMVTSNIPSYEQVEYYCTIILKYITEELFNKYIKDTDRCQISVTDITYIIPVNTIKTNFTTYSQYINYLKASASIPIILDNKIRKIGSRYYIDGGLTNNMPTIDDNTLKISCIDYPVMNANIYPKYICKLIHIIKPPTEKYILDISDLGYSDMDRYLSKYIHKDKIITQDNNLNEIINNIINVYEFSN